jgi:cytochrome c oxidase cbb3-type subunit 2
MSRRTTLAPVLAGTALAVGLGFGLTVVLPFADAANTKTDATTRTYTKGQVAGHKVYVNQGCVYCHTQQVRDTFTDAGLGPVPSRPRDALRDRPAQFGSARFGPDLTCVADRAASGKEATDEDAIAAMMDYLRDPAEHHPGSTMPSYRTLSPADLRHLAQYLVSLHCAPVEGAE